MKIKRNVSRFIGFAATLLLLAFAAGAVAESYDATTMRLLSYEGTVEIFDPSGNSRFVLENARFASGEAMQTGEDGMASVSLDATKIVTLDNLSRVEFVKEGSHILLTLTEGTIFLDVQEKLDENESFDIQTSTMTAGIRGTVIYMNQTEEGSTFGVLEGNGQITYSDVSGARRVLDVPAGQKVSMPAPKDGQDGVDPTVSTLTQADVEGFVVDQVLKDDTLVQRVIVGSEVGASLLGGDESVESLGSEEAKMDDSPDGNWTWDEPITLVAQSASKLYDGQPLSRPSDVLVQGLPSGFSIQVAANGVQTNAGFSLNPIAHYHIYNAAGDEVTDHFTDIHMVSGVLRVDPIPVTVWTGSAEKYYDGEPLTCEDAELKTAPGYVYGDPEWRNTSVVTRTALGSETMVSVVGITLVHGTNPITGQSEEIPLFTGQRLSVCIHNEGDGDSIEFKVETLEPKDLPVEILRLYQDNPEIMAQACIDAGWDPEVLAELIGALPEEEGRTVVHLGVKIDDEATEDLMQDSTNVRITIDTEITNYNSRPLNGDEAHFTPIELEPTISITATGTQTEVGESDNTYEINWGEALASNYRVVGEELGTLTVLAPIESKLTLTAASAEKVYDGEPLKDATFTKAGLPEGYTVTATVEGSQTDAGEGENRITSYQILDADGKDVTEGFVNVQKVSGTLTVTPAPLTITTGSAEKVYDGTPLTEGEASVTGLAAGETATVTATGSLTRAGTADNTYEIAWGTAKESNYTVETETLGTLTVEALSLSIDCGGAEASYSGSVFVPAPVLTYNNGDHAGEKVTGTRVSGLVHRHLAGSGDTPLREGLGRITFRFGLFTGDQVELAVTGLGTSAGSYTLTGTVSASAGNDLDFDVSFTGTTLTIKPAELTVTTPSGAKMYDGTALTAGPATLEGLVDADAGLVTVTATGTITEAGTAKNTYTIDWGTANSGNYTITENLGTLEVVVNDTPVTVTAATASKPYDGTDLTDGTFTVSGLPGSFTCTATVTGVQHNPGTSDNVVSDIRIFDADNADITAAFTNVTGVKGTLTVTTNSTPVTVTAASVSKVYDGQPAGGWVGVTVEGLPGTVDYMADCEYYVENVGTKTVTPQLMIFDEKAGVEDPLSFFTNITYVSGTVTVEPLQINFNMGADAISGVYGGGSDHEVHATYLNGDHKGEALTYVDATLFAGGLPHTSGVRYRYALFTGDEAYLRDVNADYTDLYVGNQKLYATASVGGENSANYVVTVTNINFTITPAPLTITTPSDSKPYDGTALKAGPATVNGLAAADSGNVTVTAVGSRTDVGSSENSYSIDWGTAESSNYELTEDLGTLTVTANTTAITVTAASAEKTYDGEPLTASGVTVTNLPAGFTYTAATSGSQTDAGDGTNTVSSFVIKDAADRDVTAFFTGITKEAGTLTVEPLPVTIEMESGWYPYYGEYQCTAAHVYSTNSDFELVREPQSTTDPHVYWHVDWGWGDSLAFVFDGCRDVGTYTLSHSAVTGVGSTKVDNYSITWTGDTATFTVRRLGINIYPWANHMSRDLSAAPLTPTQDDLQVQYENGIRGAQYITPDQFSYGDGVITAHFTLFTGDEVVVTSGGWAENGVGPHTVTTSGSVVSGSADNFLFNYNGNSNYTISFTGTVTVTADSASKAYDGTALTAGGVTAAGLPAGYTCTGTASGTQTAVGSSENTVTAYTILDAGGDDVTDHFPPAATADGTLTVTANGGAITVTSADAEGVYSPFGLRNANYTVEGLPAGLTLTAEVTGEQTVGGSSPNTIASYTITDSDGADVTEYFTNVTLVEGTLTLAKDKIDLWSVSETITYDGDWHSTDVYYRGARGSENPGTQISTYNHATVRNAGSYDATYDVGPIRWDLRDKYEVGTVTYGTITINPVQLSFTAADATVYRTGDYVVPEVTLTYVNGSKEGQTVTPSSVSSADGTAVLTYNLLDSDTVTLTLQGLGREAGTYTVTGALTFDSETTAFNYTAAAPSCAVTIQTLTATVTTGSAEKVYDGTALTAAEASITGLAAEDEGKVTVTAAGSLTDADSVDNTYTINWGTVNGAKYQITEALGTLTVKPLQLQVDLGGKTETYRGAAFGVPEVRITYLNGDLEGETETPGTAASSGAGVEYGVGLSKLGNGEEAAVKVQSSGELKDAGTYTLTANTSFSHTPSGNYTVSYVHETFNIEPAVLTVTTDSAAKVFDGTPLTAAGTSFTGLKGADAVTVTADGTLTDAGEADNTYTIGWGSVSQDNYTVAESLGTLTVEPLQLNFNVQDVTMAYANRASDAPFANVTLTIGNGPHAGETVSHWYNSHLVNTKTEQLVAQDEYYMLFTGDRLYFDIWGMNRPVGTYELKTSGPYAASGYTIKKTNYSLTFTAGTWTVTPRGLTVTTATAAKAYDGTPLTDSSVTLTGVDPLDESQITATATGTITDVGVTENPYTINWGTVDPANYALTEVIGTLTVTANETAVTLTAASADKVYDGTALTADEFTVTGLPGGFTCTATVSGGQTDAGGSANRVTAWTILNANGDDVTAAFNGVTAVDGTLTVAPKPIEVTTDSAEKSYDGTPLTAPGGTITGLVEGETATVAATGSLTEVGSTANTCGVITWGTAKAGNYAVTENPGTLTVTANTEAVTVTAASAEKTYDGTPLTAPGGTAAGLPAGFTCTVTASGSQTAAGVGDNTVTSYAILNADSSDVTAYFSNVTTANGTLTVKKAAATIKTGGASKVYDGAPATSTDAPISGFIETDITVTPNGSQTDAGSSSNTYDVDWGSADPDNYDISVELGSLEVTPLEVTFDLYCYDKPFNSYPMLPETIIGTYAGGGDVEQVSEVFGEDADGNFRSLTAVFNLTGGGRLQLYTEGVVNEGDYTLIPTETMLAGKAGNYRFTYDTNTGTIEPLMIWISLAGYEPVYYDGEYHGATPNVSCDEEMFFGELEAVDETHWRITNANGDVLTLTITGGGTDTGEYDLSLDVEVSPGREDNYDFDVNDQTLEILPKPVTFTVSGTRTYNGQNQTGAVVVTGVADANVTETSAGRWNVELPGGAEFQIMVTGGGTDAGTYPCYLALGGQNGAADNYMPTLEDGSVTIEAATLTIETGSAGKTFDGTPLTCDTVTVSGFADSDKDTVIVSASGEITDVGTASNTYAIEWGTVNDGNYAIAETLGTLEVTKAKLYLGVKSTTQGYTGRFIGPATSDMPSFYKTPEESAYHWGTRVEGGTYDLALPTGDSIRTVTAGGGIDPGEYTLTVESYEFLSGSGSNYEITLVDIGTVTIEGEFDDEFVITVDSSEKVFDGTPLTNDGVSISPSLKYGTITFATPGGSQTDVGESANTLPSYQIKNSAGEDVTDRYTNITVRNGTLKVTKLDLTVDLKGQNVEYGTMADLENPVMTYAGGDYDGQTVPGSQTDPTSHGDMTFSLYTGDTIRVAVVPPGTSADTYTLNANVTCSGSLSNYDIALTNRTYTITRRAIIITTGTESKAYDGAPLPTNTDRPDVTGNFVEDDVYVDTDGVSITDVNSVTRGYSISWGSADPNNYEITENLGTLTISQLQLSVNLGGKTMSYGHATHELEPKITFGNGPSVGETVGADIVTPTEDGYTAIFSLYTDDVLTLTVTGFDSLDAGPYTLSGSCSFSGKASNYDVSFTGTGITVSRAGIRIHTDGESAVYDGNSLPTTTDWPSVSGEIPDDGVGVYPDDATITDVGSVKRGYIIEWNGANPDNYAIEEDLGTLTISKLEVEITLGGFTGYYDGEGDLHYTAGPEQPQLVYKNGDHKDETVSPTSTGSGTATFTLFTGATVTVTYSGYSGQTEPNTYTLSGTATLSGGSASNYGITCKTGKVVIEGVTFEPEF